MNNNIKNEIRWDITLGSAIRDLGSCSPATPPPPCTLRDPPTASLASPNPTACFARNPSTRRRRRPPGPKTWQRPDGQVQQRYEAEWRRWWSWRWPGSLPNLLQLCRPCHFHGDLHFQIKSDESSGPAFQRTIFKMATRPHTARKCNGVQPANRSLYLWKE